MENVGTDMPEVVFLGGFFPPELSRHVSADSRGKIGFSNHNFEISLIKGLAANCGEHLHILSIPKVYSYPHNNSSLLTRSERFEMEGVPARSAGFPNLAVVNKPLMALAGAWMTGCTLRRALGHGREAWLIQNTPSFWGNLAVSLATLGIRRRVRTCLVTPDIPQMVETMGGKRRGVKQAIVGWLNDLTMRMASRYDCHVLLTEAMTDYLDNPGPHIVMEGIIATADESVVSGLPERGGEKGKEILKEEEVNRGEVKERILYSGTLRREFGVMNLVNAFLHGDFPGTVLEICGSGDCAKEIASLAKANPALIFHGLVDAGEARRLQRRATILVNPRTSEGEYTRYSFPSKTLEYLLAGKTTVIHPLPGIPEEYYQYVYLPESETAEGLAECLRRVIAASAEERRRKAEEGKEFVVSCKNATVQSGRILSLLGSLKGADATH